MLAVSLLLTAMAATSCDTDKRETVLLYTWGEYLDEATVKPAFEEAYPQYTLKVKTFDFLGFSLNTLDAGELGKAEELLLRQRKTVRPLVGNDDLKDKFISGELLAGVAWSGDHVVCQDRLEEAGQDPEGLAYALPAGSNISVDMMCIPKNAKNVDGAMALIDFLCDPDIALANCEYVGYSTPVLEARAQLDESIRENPAYYPGEELMKTLQPYYSSEQIDSTYNALWTKYLSTN